MRAAALGLVLLSASPAAAAQAVYRVQAAEPPLATAANGYVQEVRELAPGEYEVRVATSIDPIGATGTYAEVTAGARPAVPAGFRLPPSLGRRLAPELEAWEAATAILGWSARHLAVDDTDGGPQDAASVLRRGRGRCSGLANATAAMLLTAGFEARTVSGVLVAGDEVIPHRWFECRLPGAGWVPSDPTLGLWVVSVRHLAFGDTVSALPRVTALAQDEDGLERLPRRAGRLLRPNRGAGLVCRLPTAGPGAVAVLRGAGGEVRRARLDPEARFDGLLPGRWLLEVEHEGEVVERRELVLKAGDLHTFTVRPVVAGAPADGVAP